MRRCFSAATIEQELRGPSQSFDEFKATHYGKAYAAAVSLKRHYGQFNPEEVRQYALVKLFDLWRKFQNGLRVENVSSYILKAIRNGIHDEWRFRHDGFKAENFSAMNIEEDFTPSTFDGIKEVDDRDELLFFLRTINERDIVGLGKSTRKGRNGFILPKEKKREVIAKLAMLQGWTKCDLMRHYRRLTLEDANPANPG